MNCTQCDALLEKWEQPQPAVLNDKRWWPPALCTACAKQHQFRPSPARLTEGERAIETETAG